MSDQSITSSKKSIEVLNLPRATLSYRGAFVTTKYLHKILKSHNMTYREYLKTLTIHWIPKIGQAKTTYLYTEGQDAFSRSCIILPRGELYRLGIEYKSKLGTPRPAPVPLIFSGRLRKPQQILLDYLLETFTPEKIQLGKACLYLEVKPGFGKTFVGVALAARLGLKTAYVVPRRKLAVQGLADALSCLSYGGRELTSENIPVPVGCQEGKFSKKISSLPSDAQSITFFVINSFLKLSEAEAKKFSFIILDEAHMYHSAKNRNVFKMCRHAVLGLTATPTSREDGHDAIVDKQLGNVIHALDIPGFQYEASTSFRGKVRQVKYYGPGEYTENLMHASTEKIFVHYMYEQFASDPYRVALCVEELRRLLDYIGPANQRHCIFAFAEEKNNLECVRAALLESYHSSTVGSQSLSQDQTLFLDEEAAGMFTGGVPDAQIDEMTKHCRVFFATYPFAGTGVSIVRATAEIFLTPRKANMDQIVGRIFRTGGDASIERVIVDIVDTRTALAGQFKIRDVAYRKAGLPVQKIGRHYDSINLTYNQDAKK